MPQDSSFSFLWSPAWWVTAIIAGIIIDLCKEIIIKLLAKTNISAVTFLKKGLAKAIAEDRRRLDLAREDGNIRNELFIRSTYLIVRGALCFMVSVVTFYGVVRRDDSWFFYVSLVFTTLFVFYGIRFFRKGLGFYDIAKKASPINKD